MLGSIKRLEGLRARKNVEHVVNSYRRVSEPTSRLTSSSMGVT